MTIAKKKPAVSKSKRTITMPKTPAAKRHRATLRKNPSAPKSRYLVKALDKGNNFEATDHFGTTVSGLEKKYPNEIIYQRKYGPNGKYFDHVIKFPGIERIDGRGKRGREAMKNPIQKYLVVTGPERGFNTATEAVSYAQRFANKYGVALHVVEKR